MAKKKNAESNNLPLILAVVAGFLVVAGIGFYAGQSAATGTGLFAPKAPKAQQAGEGEQLVIKPGDPVVAKVGKTDIKRSEVLNYIQTLPAQTRQAPFVQLFPAALEQLINSKVIADKAAGAKLDSDPRVKEQLAAIKKNIVREVYVQKAVEDKLTEDRLTQAYDAYVAAFPEVNEARARHILVEDKSKAKDLIKQLKDGADFATLAAENSIDATKDRGGDVGYFAAGEVVPEFAEAAFGAEIGKVLDQPVKTDFGYHVIEVLEKRQRPPASYEQAKPFLEAQLRQLLLTQTIQEWKQQAGIERFDVNGEKPNAPEAAAEG
jgi:peptidyl-prolyl cis-trans isomerase C